VYTLAKKSATHQPKELQKDVLALALSLTSSNSQEHVHSTSTHPAKKATLVSYPYKKIHEPGGAKDI
jgi:hypothetical protein